MLKTTTGHMYRLGTAVPKLGFTYYNSSLHCIHQPEFVLYFKAVKSNNHFVFFQIL